LDNCTSDDSVLLETIALNGGYLRHQPVVGDVSLQLRPGEILGISGLNGSGKSTLIKSVLGLTPFRSGSVKISNIEVSKWSAERLFKTHCIGYLPQYERGFAGLTIKENIIIATKARTNPNRRHLDLEKEFKERLLGNFSNLTQYVGDLSGGERTRIALFCLVVASPKITFLDEPSAGLDTEVLGHLQYLINLWEQNGRTILLIEQNQTFLDSVATLRAELTEAKADEKIFGYTLRHFLTSS